MYIHSVILSIISLLTYPILIITMYLLPIESYRTVSISVVSVMLFFILLWTEAVVKRPKAAKKVRLNTQPTPDIMPSIETDEPVEQQPHSQPGSKSSRSPGRTLTVSGSETPSLSRGGRVAHGEGKHTPLDAWTDRTVDFLERREPSKSPRRPREPTDEQDCWPYIYGDRRFWNYKEWARFWRLSERRWDKHVSEEIAMYANYQSSAPL